MLLVLPFCNKDAQQAAKNVDWMRELDGKTGYRCMLAYPDSTDQKWIDRMLATAEQTFADVHLFMYPESSETTWPAGANWAWQSVARYIPMITDYKGNSSPLDKIYPAGTPWLWLEADAIPTKAGWLDAIAAEYQKGGKPFMGHIVKEMGHMNGVGVYPNHVSLLAAKPLQVQHAAWDVAMKEETIEFTHSANHLIQHCWGLRNNIPQHRGDDPVASFRDVGHMLGIIDPNAILFHRCKDGSLIDCLMAQRSKPQESVTPSVQAALAAPPVGGYATDQFPKTEIFIVTYHKDAEFLQYCLYSIREFATGFTGVTVVCPERDVEVIEPVCARWGPQNLKLEMFDEPELKGMLAHMAIECMADEFCSSDFILHTDSDCIFTETVTPADYFVDGKPVLLFEAYERFKDKHPGVLQWQERTSKALGRHVDKEFMRRHPAVHHRVLYSLARSAVMRAREPHDKRTFWQWATSGRNEYPQPWSEYNLLGAVAFEELHNQYHWIDTAESVPPKDKICQFWSHGGLDRPTDTGAFVPDSPRTIIKRILGI